MDVPPLVHFILSDKRAICSGSRASAEKRLGAGQCNCREESAAGCSTGRAPKCKHISPCPWSEGDGRRIFVRRTASIGPGVVFNRLETGWTANFLKLAPIGRGLWRVTCRTRTSKLSNSNGVIGTKDRCALLVARIRVFIVLNRFIQGHRREDGVPLPATSGARARHQ